MMTAQELEKEFHALDAEYELKFGEGIALFEMPQMSGEEINAAIRRCLETNTPYEYPTLPDGSIS